VKTEAKAPSEHIAETAEQKVMTEGKAKAPSEHIAETTEQKVKT
jgi:hypothetical protein